MGSRSADLAQGNRHNLPVPLTSFVGRGQEMQDIEALLGVHRLVTIIGPGGTGKTRLAIEVGRRLADRFNDGVWIVELAQIDDPSLVPAALATALRVPESRDQSVLDAVAATLRRRHTMLVLDNCEHVVDAAASDCERLLGECEDLRVLATSRQPLGIAGEARVRLAPLPTPPVDFEPDRLSMYDGAALFVDRARLVDPSFNADADTAVVADVVRQLDGAPLALELAASQLDVMDIATLRGRLGDRFEVLVNPGRAETSRQASLSACVEWSYDRLEPAEQVAFRSLSVFPAPFTSGAARAVVGEGAQHILEQLVRRCMLTPPRAGADGNARFGMLETLRMYAGTQLEPDSADRLRAAAAKWLTKEAERVGAGFLSSPDEARAAAWMDAEYDNLRESFHWAIAHDRVLALRLAVAWAPWWALRARFGESRAHLTEACADLSEPAGLLDQAHVWLGWTSVHMSDFESCIRYCEGVTEPHGRESPTIADVDALNCVAGAYLNTDRLPQAKAAADRARQYALDLGYPTGEVFGCIVLSAVAIYEGDPDAALRWARQVEHRDAASISGYTDRWRLLVLSDALQDSGDLDGSYEVATRLLAQARHVGDGYLETTAVNRLAELCLEIGREDEARELTHEAVTKFAELNDALMLTDAMRVTARFAATRRPLQAAELIAARAASLSRLGTGPMVHDDDHVMKTLHLISLSVSPEQVAAANERGSHMATDEAVQLAQTLLADIPTEPAADAASVLSKRERELLTLVAEGMTDQQIAQRLFISVRTVRSHLDRIRDKTGCRRRAELTRLVLGMQ